MITLIIPPSPFLLDERVFMSLGPLKVAAALESYGEAVEVLDLSGVGNYTDAFADYLKTTASRCFGFTATSPQLPAAVRLAGMIGSRDRIILGGPHVTLVNAACKRDNKRNRKGRAQVALAKLFEHFDCLVAGDGEKAIMPALSWRSPPVIDADDRRSPYWMADDQSPWPARELVDVGSYHYQIDGVPALSLIAQLGCPFGCGFCAGRHSPMLRHIRSRSSMNIVSEMAQMRDLYGTRGFMFYDDELNVSTTLIELLELIEREQSWRGEQWRLRGFIKAELFTDEQAAAMRRAGFRWILVGFESGSERILTNINKKATQADNTRCVEIAHRHGLKVKALMSLGHPGESTDTIAETNAWLSQVRPDDFDLTIITPYPGSPYYDDAEILMGAWVYRANNGDALYQSEVDYTAQADYYKGAPGDYVAHVWTDDLTPGDLVHARDYLEQRLRARLNIPYNAAATAQHYEHSMGQSGLPMCLLRSSSPVSTMRSVSREI